MLSINWDGLPRKDYNTFMQKLAKDRDDASIKDFDIENNILGQIRVGEICFDVSLFTYGKKENAKFNVDCYVYGIGNYGIAKNGAHYELDGGFSVGIPYYKSYEQFLYGMIVRIIEYISNANTKIQEKAEANLLIW